MEHTAHLVLFFGLVFGVVILPGLDMAFVLASALVGGRRAGFAAVAGLVAGGVCQVAIGATGTAVLLRTAPSAFAALLVAGSVYMAWIGIGLLGGGAGLMPAVEEGDRSGEPRRAFRRAMVTNLLNPKAHLFMLAVFPQFVRREYGPLWIQGIVLGTIIAATQAAVYGGVAWSASAARDRLAARPGMLRFAGRAVGLLLVVTAIFSAASGLRSIQGASAL
jgi:threonine/homoserine/homoserine lactone efflux protein